MAGSGPRSDAVQGLVFYLVTYAVTVVGAFGVVGLIERKLAPEGVSDDLVRLAAVAVEEGRFAEAEAQAMVFLEKVRIPEQASKFPAQLSGGQQQRVAIARSLINHPPLLFADEPTGNLDSKNGDAVMDLLENLHKNGSTIVMVTHDARFARHAVRSVHLFDGRVVQESAITKEAETSL